MKKRHNAFANGGRYGSGIGEILRVPDSLHARSFPLCAFRFLHPAVSPFSFLNICGKPIRLWNRLITPTHGDAG